MPPCSHKAGTFFRDDELPRRIGVELTMSEICMASLLGLTKRGAFLEALSATHDRRMRIGDGGEGRGLIADYLGVSRPQFEAAHSKLGRALQSVDWWGIQ
jgi:hypothetical protein